MATVKKRQHGGTGGTFSSNTNTTKYGVTPASIFNAATSGIAANKAMYEAQKTIAANKASNKTSSNGVAPKKTNLNTIKTPTNVLAAALGAKKGVNTASNKNASTTTKKPATGTGSSSSGLKTPVGSGVNGNLSSVNVPSSSGNSSIPNWNYSTDIDRIIADLQAQYAPKEVTPYQSAYENQINSIIDKIVNREQFSYDMNADPLYQQYKDQYTKQGEQAMKNSIAEAAALTGGYGNSYAETAGNQAYQAYLGKLNEVVPELYQIAYGQYRDEGSDLYDKLDMYSGLDQSDYTKYLNDVSQTNLENSNAYSQLRDRISDAYNLEDYNYQRYSDSYNAAVQKAELERQAALEARQLALQQLQADRDYSLSLQQLAAEQAAAKSSASASSSEARAELVNDYYKEMKALLDAEDIENPGNYRNSLQKVYGLIESATGSGILSTDEANELLFRLGISAGDMSKILGTDGKYYSLDEANTILNAAGKNLNRVSNILGLGEGTYEKLYKELMKL